MIRIFNGKRGLVDKLCTLKGVELHVFMAYWLFRAGH